MVDYLGLKSYCDTKYATFSILLAGNKRVFMCAVRRDYWEGYEPYAVIVDTQRFLKLWQEGMHEEALKHGNAESWRKDYKYHLADSGFSYGIQNPVPLATTDIYVETKTREIRHKKTHWFGRQKIEWFRESVPTAVIENGITRTIWLLANGAKAFPVKCSPDGADTMYKLAGVENRPPVLISRLFAGDRI